MDLVNSSAINGMSKALQGARMIWPVAFSVVSCAIIIANILTITVFTRATLRRVRKRTHYLLVSLALADLMVGSLSCPLFIRDLLFTNEHRSTKIRLATHEVIDIVSGFASVLTLASVAVERWFAVRWPLKHKIVGSYAYCLLIGMPWFIAMVISMLYLLGFIYGVVSSNVLSFVAIACLSMALLIVIVAYAFIWKKAKGREWKPRSQGSDQERRLARTLITVTCASLICWLPFEVLLIVFHTCKGCREPFKDELSFMYKSFKLLQFSNSFINTIIYSFRIPEFNRAIRTFWKQLKCKLDAPIPPDRARSVQLTSIRKFLVSPRLDSERTRPSILAVVYSGQMPSKVIMNSPLLSLTNHTTARRSTNAF
ncbi:predicted protein [Nematostella vectensis]|uniref:G-protein coupled receptors family 1 profile domain-containing protein n=1 Tax=Nematostella vectensis TaxID=45351 RepID=A7RES1_NEMVE|nr:predicted protein [Nematostella vectensis]|eukprot:XP_001641902.1 predicted protein [Nematostella vectensis]